MIDLNKFNSDNVWASMLAMMLYNSDCKVEELKNDRENFLQEMKEKGFDDKFVAELYDELIRILENHKTFT